MKQVSFPEPDQVTLEKPSLRKYLGYLKFFGPGAIVASLTIGQGQLILGPQIGAWAGYTLLWLITLNMGSYIIAYVSCRFTMISGVGLMDLFSIKARWINWLFIVIMIIFIPIFTASIVTSLGQSLQWIFGRGHYLLWGILFCLFAAFLALVGRYRLLEYSQAFFVAVLAVGAVAAVISLKPDILSILPHFFMIGDVPDGFPSWVIEEYPSVTRTSIPLYMLGYLGTLTVTIITLIGYIGWIKVKGWGIFKGRDDPEKFSQECFSIFKERGELEYLPQGRRKRVNLLLKPLSVDLSMAFILVSLVSAAYMIAGAILLAPNHLLPEDTRLVQNQLIIFTCLSDWLKPLFQISVFFALFGTVYSGFEAATRMLYETAGNLSKRIRGLSYRRFMFYLLVYLLCTGIPLAVLMMYGLSVLLMLSLTLMFIGVIGVILYGIGAIILTQKVLPREYALGVTGVVCSIVAIVLLLIPVIYLFI